MILLPLLCLLCPGFGPASAQEIKPDHVVNVSEDADALLPCALGPGQDKFDWRKDNGGEKKEVFMYKRGSYYGHGLDGQSEQFRGRVVFFQDELRSGNASIKIQNTRLEDNGTYTCVLFKPNTNEVEKEITIRLNVVGVLKIRKNIIGLAPVPYIKTVRDKITWRLLECKAQGVPEPEVEWRNSAGEVLRPTEKYKHYDGRFHVQFEVNVTKTDNYTCVATQSNIYHQINNTLVVSFPDVVHSLTVSEGDDAVLPCSIDSKENIENMLFSWSKDDKEVFFYNRHRVEEDGQLKGRLTYFQHKLMFGNASIKILNTQKSDSGRYSCHVPDIQKSHVILQVIETSITFKTIIIVVSVLLGVAVIIIVLLIVKLRKRNKRDILG